MDTSSRDKQLLALAGVIGLLVGGVSGIAGGVLVSTGRLSVLARTIPSINRLTNAPAVSRESPQMPGAVLDEESATISVVRASAPAVVSIVVRKEVKNIPRGNAFEFDDFFRFGIPFAPPLPQFPGAPKNGGKQQVGGGSGFIVTSDGYILTNRHVVRDADAEYAVILNDDREFPAKVLAKDPVNDLAVLKIDVDPSKGPLPVLALGDSDSIQTGETVIAIGYALSEFRNSVTKGVISGINRRVIAGDSGGSSEVIDEAIQTDAAINPGNSGGPLLNLRGNVVGVNTAVSQEGQLLGFAIPINVAKQVVESVIRDGKITRPWLGVRYLAISDHLATAQKLPVKSGALVVRGDTPADVAVVPGSPADRAGIRENDIVTMVGSDPVTEEHPLSRLITKRKPGDRVTLTVLRSGKERKLTVQLEEFPQE
ncbi:trypsin-like peptidase domain-containing protein [Candidatus Uhrbacteria bacterium]|nr:trypsin-like peptidase domain-containing protein [Candidatus Uhrbacteria bacterium]